MTVPTFRRRSPSTGSRTGQSLVELALILPLLLVLFLGAVDFGRAFFGWVALNNASRVGANYAATHPDAWALGNSSQQDEYTQLVENSGTTDCVVDVAQPTFPDGSRDLGNRARVDLTCGFSLFAPFMQVFFGDPVYLSADSTFPIGRGCIGCAAAPAESPPPAADNCRLVPDMIGGSVAGARLKWAAAGFTGPFVSGSAEDWRTVSSQRVDQGGAVGCSGREAFFTSSVEVTPEQIVRPGPGDTCRTVPDVRGMPVADGRDAWETAGFDRALFSPRSGSGSQIIATARYTPSDAAAGECREPDLEVSVTYGPPPGPPPPPPCQVPSFVNTIRRAAQNTWKAAKFTTKVQFGSGNWRVVKRQDLVGGSYAACSSTVKLFR